MRTVRVDVVVLGERNFPIGFSKVGEEAVSDYAALLLAAQKKNPAANHDDVIKSIWRLGSVALADRLRKGWLIDTDELPGPAVADVAVDQAGSTIEAGETLITQELGRVKKNRL